MLGSIKRNRSITVILCIALIITTVFGTGGILKGEKAYAAEPPTTTVTIDMSKTGDTGISVLGASSDPKASFKGSNKLSITGNSKADGYKYILTGGDVDNKYISVDVPDSDITIKNLKLTASDTNNALNYTFSFNDDGIYDLRFEGSSALNGGKNNNYNMIAGINIGSGTLNIYASDNPSVNGSKDGVDSLCSSDGILVFNDATVNINGGLSVSSNQNTAAAGGSGINIDGNGTLNILGSLNASGGNGDSGGNGIYSEDGVVNIKGSVTATGGNGTYRGGDGISIEDGIINISGSLNATGGASAGGDGGCGIFSFEAPLNISGSVIATGGKGYESGGSGIICVDNNIKFTALNSTLKARNADNPDDYYEENTYERTVDGTWEVAGSKITSGNATSKKIEVPITSGKYTTISLVPNETTPPAKKPAVAKPSKVSKVKCKAAKKKITISWKKDSKATGYQLQYSTKKNFKKGKKYTKTVKINKGKTVKKTIKKLKAKKTYYVRVRAFNKKADGKLQYGSWSKTVKKKTK